MAEPYLPGQEITISVFPDGTSLPIAERFAQNNGVAPYNGDVPVTQNSRAVTEKTAARPHRMNQNCLTMISAAAQGWSYFDLLHKMLESRWQL